MSIQFHRQGKVRRGIQTVEEAAREPDPVPEPEVPTAPRRRRRRRSRSSSRTASRTHSRLRLLYFALATTWGFVVGTAAILGGLSFVGQPIRLEPELAAVLLLAGVVAVVGGLVAAAAYRDVIRRFR